MKRFFLSLFAMLITVHFSYAQLYTTSGYGSSYIADGSYVGWNSTSGSGGETNFVNNIGGGITGGFTFDNTTRSNVSTRLMTILGNGNVGIGTNSPYEKLEILGGFLKSGYVSIGNNTTIGPKNYITLGADQHASLFLGSNLYLTSDGGTSALKIANTHPTMAGAGILIPGNSQSYQNCILFHTTPPASVTANASYSNCRMIITDQGRVGIGTTSPDQKLTVNGTIHSKEVKVDTSIPVPDYVFEENYQLKSLKELQDYIIKNKHLPEIPSANEMEKAGINLSEMNLKLLKKVEELTLYLIEKDTENKELAVKYSYLAQQLTELKSLITTNKK